MKPTLVLGVGILIAATVAGTAFMQFWGPEIHLKQHEEQVPSHQVSVEQLVEFQEQGGVVIVDSGSLEDFQDGHLPGAIHCTPALLEENTEELLLRIPQGVPIVVTCRRGCNSGVLVAARLREAGYGDVRSLKGGVEAWQAAGHPLVN